MSGLSYNVSKAVGLTTDTTIVKTELSRYDRLQTSAKYSKLPRLLSTR